MGLPMNFFPLFAETTKSAMTIGHALAALHEWRNVSMSSVYGSLLNTAA